MTSENRSAHHPPHQPTDHRSTARGSREAAPAADLPVEPLDAVDPLFADTADHPGDYLSALLDHELDPATARSVGDHVDGCNACLAELTSLERIRRIIRDLPPVTAPSGYVAGLIDDRQRATRRGMALAGVAACLVVVASLIVAEPLESAAPDEGDVAGHDDLVRLEAKQARDDDELERSLFDRAHAAASDMLEFFAG